MKARPIPTDTYTTVVEVLAKAADLNADVEAYVEPRIVRNGVATERKSLTFAEWNRAAEGVAGWLAAEGVGKGDFVCLVLPSSIDFAIAYAGIMRLGAVTSAINPRLGKSEFDSVVERSQPVVTILDSSLGLTLPSSSGKVLDRAEIQLAVDGSGPSNPQKLHGDDPVAVVWTSGTSGRPKGAVFDHSNLAAVAAGTDVLSSPGDRRLSPLPFAHVGYMTRAWDEIAHAITTVITPTPWRASEALTILTEEAITVAQGVPTQWALILDLDELGDADVSQLRIVSTGAAKVPMTLVTELRERFGVPVVVRYTSTETSLGTGTLPTDPLEAVAVSVGRPVPGVELSIQDEDGSEVPSGSVGRIHLRSGATMRGYFGRRADSVVGASGSLIDRETTDAVLDGAGWLKTGDFGWCDEAGNLRLVGRANEMYIRGGYNIYPAEIEEVLVTHPTVAEAAVLGVPDPVLGEIGVAFVVPSDNVPASAVASVTELRAFCATRLADYKAPDVVVVVEDLPLTAMMKVDKKALQKRGEELANSRRDTLVQSKEEKT